MSDSELIIFLVYGFTVRQKDYCDGSFRKMGFADVATNYDRDLKENFWWSMMESELKLFLVYGFIVRQRD